MSRKQTPDLWGGEVLGDAPHIPFSFVDAGSNQVQGAPGVKAFGSDSAKFVKVPWDVLQFYYFMLSFRHVSAGGIPAGMVGREGHCGAGSLGIPIREGNESLGQVVHPSWRRGELIGMHPFKTWWCAQAQPFLPSRQRCRSVRSISRVSNEIDASRHCRRGRS